jgi:hypothetical protein
MYAIKLTATAYPAGAGRNQAQVDVCREDALPTLSYVTSERAQAYGRVMSTLADVGASKLQGDEQERVRAAADVLLFCEDVSHDDSARDALADIEALERLLVESGRWSEARASQLADEIRACGPLSHVSS